MATVCDLQCGSNYANNYSFRLTKSEFQNYEKKGTLKTLTRNEENIILSLCFVIKLRQVSTICYTALGSKVESDEQNDEFKNIFVVVVWGARIFPLNK